MEKALIGEQGREDVSRLLREIGERGLLLRAREAEMNAELDAVKERYMPDLERLAEERDALAKRLRLVVEDNRRALLPKGRKSLGLTFGVIGFRKQGTKVRLLPGVKTEDAVRSLERRALDRFVQVSKTVARQAIQAALRDGQIAAETLRGCGVDVVPGGDHFFFEVDYESVLEAQRA